MHQFFLLLHVTRSHAIARRYFVVNGFDGALTMLGIITGFYVSGDASLTVIISACLGATIALAMSGVSSAYISEAAERQQELKELENAMVRDLSESAHGQAARYVPLFIATVNGMAPLVISLVIVSPLWLDAGFNLAIGEPLAVAMSVAFVILFFLGVFLGKVSGTFWLISGLRTLVIGLATCAIIYLLTP